jgi:hypothetical protein
MPTDWISADEARSMVLPAISMRATEAISERAADGMIAARAKRLIWGDRVSEDAPVPPEFWRARNHSGTLTNWASGDFDAWLAGRTHCRAYGVEFLRAHIEDMLPKSQRLTVPSPAPGNYEPAMRCVAELTKSLGGDQARAIDLILKNCQAGLLPSRCARLWCRTSDRYGSEEETETSVAVPDWVWEQCLTNDEAILNWDADRFAGTGLVDGETRKVRLEGLSFEVGAVAALEAIGADYRQTASEGLGATETASRAGGRKLSELWPDWVAEFVVNIYDHGWPDGTGSQGQEELICRVANALAERGLEGPSRATVQRTVQATLQRWRDAKN